MSVIKTSTTAAVEVTAFHKDVANIAIAGMRSQETMHKRMVALITSRYGDTAPTFEQHRADIKAFGEVAKSRKLASDQWIRRPYNAAIIALFEKLPVSMAPDAVQKREQREARDKLVKAAIAKAKESQTMQAVSNPVGAPAGETQEREPSDAEKLEQMVTRCGVFETLYACLRILDSDESTHAQVVHMRKMADAAKKAADKATAAARAKAITPTTIKA